MSAIEYDERIIEVLGRIRATQMGHIQEAGSLFASAIAAGRTVYLFGSGHSVIPVMDVFPRYGSFVGFVPLYDPRLMWWNVVGPGGARELLWLERKEGYVQVFLQSWPLEAGDALLVFSHGGLNAAPIEAALHARSRGLLVVSVTSLANAAQNPASHSSGKKLSDLADVAIDNCVPPEDALVNVGRKEKLAAGSTMAAVYVAMALVAETGSRLVAQGFEPSTFVSPNVPGVAPGHNQGVFETYARRLHERATD
ncbi:MAG TPA: SIS domain-containing protein [Vicinamibacteria bacterium]|nr:SIS domain-containing protein [Vicinamibacteria bacterium]